MKPTYLLCINNSYCFLTKGKIYKDLGTRLTTCVKLRDDTGELKTFVKTRFIEVKGNLIELLFT